MRRLWLVPLVSLTWISCGGEDESQAPPLAQAEQAVMEVVLLPALDEATLAEVREAGAVQAAAAKEAAVEERFFYPVDVTAPGPTVPVPPCPNCR